MKKSISYRDTPFAALRLCESYGKWRMENEKSTFHRSVHRPYSVRSPCTPCTPW